MSKRVSEIAQTLKQLGDIQVAEWDFMELLNTEIKDLEISRSLKRLGSVKVMDWDFRTVLPAMRKAANREVDMVDFFKRTAAYKVMDWDFRRTGPAMPTPPRPEKNNTMSNELSENRMQSVTDRLVNFLQFVAVNLIDDPDHARIKVVPVGPDTLRFRLVLVKRDVALLIGREGFTAAAIRSILKATAAMHGVHALLQIHSHEEEAVLLAREEERHRQGK